MNKTHLDSELTTPSAVGTMEIINPSTEVEPARATPREISEREPVNAKRKAWQWCQRLLELAAQNPPHPV